ncbi:MAG: acyltransferase family protein [Streptosporangiaceae bacterium]
MSALGQLARRIDAATPPQRDRAVDALRALAIAGVIGGHWLVTALVLSPGPASRPGHGGTVLSDNSPLASMPWLAPLSWVFQTLAVFFLVGGYSAARSYRGQGKVQYLPWLRKRMIRLAKPILALAAVWVPVTAGLVLAGVPAATVHTIVFLVISPLWFLGVYAALTALTPAAMWLVRRFGAWAAAFPVAVVAAADLVRFGLHGPSWIGWINLPAGWLVPYLLGVAWAQGWLAQGWLAPGWLAPGWLAQGWLAQGSLRGRRVPALMLAGGAAATAALIAWAGYPASMVGVNGAHISNLNPPTLAAVTFGIAQCGLALLLRDRLARLMRRPLAWAAIAMVNLSAMTLFLWHQTAFVAVSSVGLLVGRVPGLLTAPASGLWVAERLAWLPVFAIMLSGLWLAFRRVERG